MVLSLLWEPNSKKKNSEGESLSAPIYHTTPQRRGRGAKAGQGVCAVGRPGQTDQCTVMAWWWVGVFVAEEERIEILYINNMVE